jgi:hypothetical protein
LIAKPDETGTLRRNIVVGSKNETGRSAANAMSVAKVCRSQGGATGRTPRRVVEETETLKV